MAKIVISRQQILNQLSPSEVRKYYNNLDENIFDRHYYHNDKKEFCKNGESIEIGTHGPETKNGKIYISIYHYLELLKLNPHDYQTEELGKFLTNNSGGDYIYCKYKDQNFKINKFELNFLKREEKNGLFKGFLY